MFFLFSNRLGCLGSLLVSALLTLLLSVFPSTRGLGLASAVGIVVAAGYAVSGAERAANTLTWLGSHGYEHLANDALVVLTDTDEVSNRVHKDVIRDHLSSMCRGVFVVPPDESVADGDRSSLANVRPRTRDAYAEVAAALVDGYR